MANVANVEAALEELRTASLPAPLDEWRIETGLDWSDDPAIWVWLPIGGDDMDNSEIDKLVELQDIVHKRVKTAVDDDSLVYIRFYPAPPRG